MTKYGRLRTDDDGHWYLVPEELVEQFDAYLEATYASPHDYEAEARFIDKFDEYRTGGGIRDFRVVIED